MASFCDMAYTWDAHKNKTSESITGVMNGYGFTSGGTTNDFEDRLTGYARASGTFNQSWNLTSVGDWTSVTTDVKGSMTVIPAVLSGLQPPASSLSLTWTFDNTLASSDIDANGTADVSFQYDALGRRVARIGTSGSFVFAQINQQYSVNVITTHLRPGMGCDAGLASLPS